MMRQHVLTWLLAATFLLSIQTLYGQQKASEGSGVSLPSNPTLRQVIAGVEAQTPYRFVYQTAGVPLDASLNWPAQYWLLSKLLIRLQQDARIEVQVIDYQIVLRSAAPLRVSTNRYLSGYVRDIETGEVLIGATISDPDNRVSVSSNTYGYYVLPLQQDSCLLRVSYWGYETQVIQIGAQDGRRRDIQLRPGGLSLEVVTIEAAQPRQTQNQMSQLQFDPEVLRYLPSLGGESDLLRSLQLLPGFQGGTEGSAGFFVRGGSPDQNLIILDGVPLYNVSHLFGFLSVFNADAIRHVEAWKGAFPARYGGRLASVLDISLREGDRRQTGGRFTLSPVASRLLLEGPILQGRASWIISARRSLAEPFLGTITRRQKQAAGAQGGRTQYYLYDLNAKFNVDISSRDRLFLSYYQGRDDYRDQTRYESLVEGTRFQSEQNSRITWGNRLTALRWNHLVSDRLFSNLTLYYSKYQFQTNTRDSLRVTEGNNVTFTQYALAVGSSVQDLGLKWDWQAYAGKQHQLKWGMQWVAHRFIPGSSSQLLRSSTGQVSSAASQETNRAQELYAYAEDDLSIGKRLQVNLGLHISSYHTARTTYASLQPRIILNLVLHPQASLKASLVRMTQYLHLLTNSGVGLPTDLWIGATDAIGPQQAWQTGVGYVQQISARWRITGEAYFKTMQGLYTYREGASFFLNTDRISSKITEGSGEAWGSEIWLERHKGRTTGWLSYGLAWSYRQFDALNQGMRFPFTYDRRHDLALVINQVLSPQWRASLTWEYASGRAVTLPVNTYVPNTSIPGSIPYVPLNPILISYGTRNSYRFKPYHRLDLAVSWEKSVQAGTHAVSLSLYNAYNRLNTFYLSLEPQPDGSYRLVDNALFPVIPGFSYGFTF